MNNNDEHHEPGCSESRLNLSPPTTASPKAFYEQIMDGIKQEVAQGSLPAHTPLPSFRLLAKQLLVSTITVKRAYEELEREGVIYFRQRMGTFVAEDGAFHSREIKRRKADAMIKEAIGAARDAGYSEQEVINELRRIFEEERNL